ncbi:MAG: response regulator, partial [Deltaproteobacteria bacterium]|nr:response regulator [Deltaproteobacteria bacterium]
PAELTAQIKAMIRLGRAERLLRMKTEQLEFSLDKKSLELKESEERFRVLVQNHPDTIIVNIDGKFAYVNPAGLQLYAASKKEDLLGRLMLDHIRPEDRDLVTERMHKVLITGITLKPNDVYIIRLDGTKVPVTANGVRIIYGGKPAILSVLRDITERKRLEDAQLFLIQYGLVHSGEDFFQSLARYLAENLDMDYVCIDRLEGDLLAARTLAVYFDGKFEDNVTYTLKDTPCGDVVGKTICCFPRVVRQIFPKDIVLQEMVAESYVGTTLWSSTGQPIGLIAIIGRKPLENPQLAESILRLVAVRAAGELERQQAEDEKAKLEKQLIQAQKMEAIGTLAGGIAHDFNNILAAILGYTELAMMDIPEGMAVRGMLEQVTKAGHRAKDLIQQILSFSRRTTQERKPIQLTFITKETLKFLRASLPTTIEIRQNFDPGVGTVLADPTQIHQVLTNLCANAAHAMREKGGILEVKLTQVDLDEQAAAQLEGLPPGIYQQLTIADTGHGMDQSIIERIFEPFFTTKGPGEGTGMGLSVVYGIVKDHGGAIKVYSEAGKGSVFHIFLPSVPATFEDISSVAIAPLAAGTERILLVDDEEALAAVGRGILMHLGYRVTSLTSSLEALEVFRTDPTAFDLILTDQTMPKMTGIELARAAMKIRPDIPIILCTGFSQQVSAEMALGMGIKRFLMKPLVLREVAEVIRVVLDNKN